MKPRLTSRLRHAERSLEEAAPASQISSAQETEIRTAVEGFKAKVAAGENPGFNGAMVGLHLAMLDWPFGPNAMAWKRGLRESDPLRVQP